MEYMRSLCEKREIRSDRTWKRRTEHVWDGRKSLSRPVGEKLGEESSNGCLWETEIEAVLSVSFTAR